MLFRLQIPTGHSAELNWIASVIFDERLGLEVVIEESGSGDYLLEHGGKTLAIRNEYFSRQTETGQLRAFMPDLPLDKWVIEDGDLACNLLSNSVPVLFGVPGFEERSDGDARLGLDVLGSAFFMLSRLEELVTSDRDAHDRFPAKASVAYAGGFLDRPLVDEYVEILWAAIAGIWPHAMRKRREFAVSISHDIDSPSFFAFMPWERLLRQAAGDCLKRGRFLQATDDIRMRLLSRHRIHRDDPYNTFDWIMDQSERFGLTSTFYVICGRNHPNFDPAYDVGHPAIRGLLRKINHRRHSIGLHASYNAYLSAERLAIEAARFAEICSAEGIDLEELQCRMHYLRWRTPDTLRNLQSAGISADATMTFADHAGFRCGTCHEYAAFDPIARERLGVTIRPLVAMEATIMNNRYMGLGVSDAAADAMLSLKDACRRVNGVFSLLWHNTQLVTEEQRSLYSSVLAG